jgi:hypothetical protein
MNLYLPGAKWCPITYRAEAGKFAGGNPIGYIPHVQQGNGSLFGYFNRLTSPNRKFSTAWVAKDGSAEQYTELTGKPWSQAAGNATYWAFECEGYVGEPLTAPQINTLAIWHNYLGTPDVLANAPGQRGIGTHYMGGTAWGGHTCPDPVAGAGPRSKQRPAIIARAQALRTPTPTPEVDMPLTQADADLIVHTLLVTQLGSTGPNVAVALQTAGAAGVAPASVAAIAAAVVALLPAGGSGATAAQIAKAVNDDAAKRLLS